MTVDLAELAPFVAELVAWVGLEECSPELIGLIRSAPHDLLALERVGLVDAQSVHVRWSLGAIVEHALVPLGALSLVEGQPVIPGLAAMLDRAVADPRLDPVQRETVVRVLAENVVMEKQLACESRGTE